MRHLTVAFIGAARPWQKGFQHTGSPLFERIIDLHNDILCVLIGIVCGVFFASAYICLGHTEPETPKPFPPEKWSKVSHSWARKKFKLALMKLIGRTLSRKQGEKRGFTFEQLLQREVAQRKVNLRSELQLRLKARKVRIRISRRLGKISNPLLALSIFLKKRRKALVKPLRLARAPRTYKVAKKVRHLLPLLARACAKSAITRSYRESVQTAFNQIPNGAPALETLWTVLPVAILAAIAMPTFSLIYLLDELHEPGLTVKAIGNQWYWSYEYGDSQGVWSNAAFDSYMLPDDELKPGQLRLLTVDKELILPTQTEIRILVTSMDVIHSWAVPSLGIKVDAVPGRLNEVNTNLRLLGIYYGQCSELCGVNHAFMPIMIRSVSPQLFTMFK